MLFGAANIDLGALGIPDVTGYREHLYQVTAGKIVFPSVNGPIPAAWPATPAGVTGFYTIYPNPDRLLAGQLDEALRVFIGSAPPQGGVLTAYAEADGDAANGGQFAPLGLTRAKLLQVHAHLQALCRGSRVKYGAVVCGTGLDQVLFCPPGLDFYALDWYDNWNPPLIRGLNAWRENLEQHVQESPVLAIAETNSNVPGAPSVVVRHGLRLAGGLQRQQRRPGAGLLELLAHRRRHRQPVRPVAAGRRRDHRRAHPDRRPLQEGHVKANRVTG